MKLHTFTQCRIDGEDNPEVIPLGKVAIALDEVIMVCDIIDKHDCVIKGATQIATKCGHSFAVKSTFAEVMELFTAFDL